MAQAPTIATITARYKKYCCWASKLVATIRVYGMDVVA